jgi:hypothetical protein
MVMALSLFVGVLIYQLARNVPEFPVRSLCNNTLYLLFYIKNMGNSMPAGDRLWCRVPLQHGKQALLTGTGNECCFEKAGMNLISLMAEALYLATCHCPVLLIDRT